MTYALRTDLEKYNEEYRYVSALFNRHGSTKKEKFQIERIERVFNPFLLAKFEQKKGEYLWKYGKLNVVKVFHGTKKSNVSSILERNLEVCRHGQNIGHRFGDGVSFSAFASYASHYCDKRLTGDQMLLCLVLVSNVVQVPEMKRRQSRLKEPPLIPGQSMLRYDTTAKNSSTMDVIVKFEDHTYYPAYIIHFNRMPHLSSVGPASYFTPILPVSQQTWQGNSLHSQPTIPVHVRPPTIHAFTSSAPVVTQPAPSLRPAMTCTSTSQSRLMPQSACSLRPQGPATTHTTTSQSRLVPQSASSLRRQGPATTHTTTSQSRLVPQSASSLRPQGPATTHTTTSQSRLAPQSASSLQHQGPETTHSITIQDRDVPQSASSLRPQGPLTTHSTMTQRKVVSQGTTLSGPGAFQPVSSLTASKLKAQGPAPTSLVQPVPKSGPGAFQPVSSLTASKLKAQGPAPTSLVQPVPKSASNSTNSTFLNQKPTPIRTEGQLVPQPVGSIKTDSAIGASHPKKTSRTSRFMARLSSAIRSTLCLGKSERRKPVVSTSRPSSQRQCDIDVINVHVRVL